MKDPKITLLICTHNGSKTIQKVLEAIANQSDISKDLFEVLVIDNASDDSTSDIASKTIQSLHLNGRVLFESQLGKVNAFLKGINCAQSEIVSIIDDDNFIEDHFIQYTLNIFAEYPRVAMVGSNNSIYIDQEVPEWFNWVKGRYACAQAWLEDIEERTDEGVVIGNTGVIAGAGSSLRVEYLKKCISKGYLFFNDAQREGETNTLVGEDIELCFLMRSLGSQFAYDPRIKVRHAINPKRLTLDYLENHCKKMGSGCLGFEPFFFTHKSQVNQWSLKWTWQWQLLAKLRRYVTLSLFPRHNPPLKVERELRNKLDRLECQGAISRILKERQNYTKHIRQVASGEWTELRVR